MFVAGGVERNLFTTTPVVSASKGDLVSVWNHSNSRKVSTKQHNVIDPLFVTRRDLRPSVSSTVAGTSTGTGTDRGFFCVIVRTACSSSNGLGTVPGRNLLERKEKIYGSEQVPLPRMNGKYNTDRRAGG